MKGIKQISSKIKTVKNVGKITKAMEMVSASKMRRASVLALHSKHLKDASLVLVKNLTKKSLLNHNLFSKKENPEKPDLLIFIGAERGLCGSFQTSLNKEFVSFLKNHDKVSIISIGIYAEKAVRKFKPDSLYASFLNLSDSSADKIAHSVSTMVEKDIRLKKFNRVFVLFNNYKSAISYKSEIQRISPFSKDGLNDLDKQEKSSLSVYTLEPSEDEIIFTLVRKLILSLILYAMRQSLASEHSSRMVAMKSASDNASSLISELTLFYNRARQETIDRELADISLGAQFITS